MTSQRLLGLCVYFFSFLRLPPTYARCFCLEPPIKQVLPPPGKVFLHQIPQGFSIRSNSEVKHTTTCCPSSSAGSVTGFSTLAVAVHSSWTVNTAFVKLAYWRSLRVKANRLSLGSSAPSADTPHFWTRRDWETTSRSPRTFGFVWRWMVSPRKTRRMTKSQGLRHPVSLKITYLRLQEDECGGRSSVFTRNLKDRISEVRKVFSNSTYRASCYICDRVVFYSWRSHITLHLNQGCSIYPEGQVVGAGDHAAATPGFPW